MDRSNSVLITKRVADPAQPKGKRYHIWDLHLAGFGLRVEVSGTKTFVVRYRAGAVVEPPHVANLEGCVVQRGVRQDTPMKERTKAYTLARLRHHVVPLLGRKRVSEVDAGEIERFVMKVTTGKTASDEKLGPRKRIIVRGGEGAARKVARDLSAVYRFAIRRGIVDSNPGSRVPRRFRFGPFRTKIGLVTAGSSDG